jgi:hypothetical protein
MVEIKEVTEHKTVKGVKGFLYKCIWASPDVEPSWEPESHIKPTADKVLNLYWRSATKSTRPEPNPTASGNGTPNLKQTLLTKRVVGERRER